MTLAPGIAVLVVAAALVVWRQVRTRRRRAPPGWLAMAGGVFSLTTAAIILTQLLRAASAGGFDQAMGITAGFVVACLVIGGLLIWLGWRPKIGIATRVAFFVLGLAAIGLLSGYFAGPVLAIAAALAPPYRRR